MSLNINPLKIKFVIIQKPVNWSHIFLENISIVTSEAIYFDMGF